MAKQSTKEHGRKVVDGIEVYEVGKQQLWNWAHWSISGSNNALKWDTTFGTIDVFADSLAKGKYLVATLSLAYDCILDAIDVSCIQDAKVVGVVTAIGDYRGMRDAIEAAKTYESLVNGARNKTDSGYLYTVTEVWHIVDDADLWQEWEYGVAKSHIEQGWGTDYHLYANRRCILDCLQALPKVVYCIYVTCDDGESVYSVDYYDDPSKFWAALDLALGLHRCSLEYVDSFYASELGITVVNDDDLDEGRADALPVSVFYLRLPNDEQ